MAKKHLTSINKIISQLEKLQTEVDSLCEELQNKYDNLSDYQQESDYGTDLQDIIDSLESASFDGFTTAIDELQNAATYLETLPTSKPKKEVNIDLDISVPLAAGLMYWDRKRSEKRKQSQQKEEPPYNPYDNHWGHSFDWVDEDGDGYDDREDGFLE